MLHVQAFERIARTCLYSIGGSILVYTAIQVSLFYSINTIFMQASMHPVLVPTFTVQTKTVSDAAIHSYYTIDIPALHIHMPVAIVPAASWNSREWSTFEHEMKIAMDEYGIAAYPHSSIPGVPGSIFLTGHSSPPSVLTNPNTFNTVFKSLPDLQPGDEITITLNNEKFSYEVEYSKIVEPSATSLLVQENTKEKIVLITCYPIGTTDERLVVTATRIHK